MKPCGEICSKTLVSYYFLSLTFLVYFAECRYYREQKCFFCDECMCNTYFVIVIAIVIY